MPLDQFDVTLTPGLPAKIQSIFGKAQNAREWNLKELDPGIGYAAAFAYHGPELKYKLFEFTTDRIEQESI